MLSGEYHVHQEVVHDEWVQVEHDAANVTNNLSEDAGAHGTHERPSPVANAKPYLSAEESKEAKHVDDIARNGRPVLDGLP
jgi:hypothetical protein